MTPKNHAKYRKLKRADILNAAQRVFSRKGFHATSMEEVARQAGYATGSLYRYFKNKDDLYSSLLEERLQGMSNYVEQQLKGLNSPRDKLEKAVFSTLRFFSRHADFFFIYARERQSLEWKIRQRLLDKATQIHAQFRQLFTAIIEEVIEDEQKPPDIAGDMASAFLGMIQGVIHRKLFGREKFDEKRLTLFINDLFFNGLKNLGKRR